MSSNDSTQPFLSIAIPTWNRVETVERLLKTIDLPSDIDFEIVVVDNHSQEEIFRKLENVCARYPKVKLFRNPTNIGMIPNWNRALELAQGKWFGFICSDDLFKPGGLRRAVETLKSLDGDYLVLQDPSILRSSEICCAGTETAKNLRLPLASGNFWTQAIFRKAGGFNPAFKYSSDGEYWNRIATRFPVAKVRDEFARYEAHDGNFAYSTWLKDDFLENTALMCEANLIHFGLSSYSPEEKRLYVDHQLKLTIRTILLSIRFNATGFKVYLKYARKGLKIEKKPLEKARFLVWLGFANAKLLAKFLLRR